jgi:prepilin-type N-terminal cleavage/methylation domain-containing protein
MRSASALRSNAGFTLVELLMATALTATIAGISLMALRGMSDAMDGATLTADLNVNLRNTLNLMTRDLLGAGGRNIPVGGIPVPSGDDVLPIVRPSPGNALAFPAGPTVHAVTHGNDMGPAIGDDPNTPEVEGVRTDIVTILMTDPTIALDGVPLVDVSADGSRVTVDADVVIDGSDNGITPGDLIWLRNGLGSTLVMVTSRDGQTLEFATGDAMNLNQPDAASGSITQLLGTPGDPIPPVTATRVQLLTYYIDDSDRERPRLMRQINMREPRAIGVVIDNLQLTFDLVDGVDNPVNVAAPASPAQIRKGNLFLSGRSFRPWRRTRAFLRTAVATQVSLRSLAFVDRYQ